MVRLILMVSLLMFHSCFCSAASNGELPQLPPQAEAAAAAEDPPDPTNNESYNNEQTEERGEEEERYGCFKLSQTHVNDINTERERFEFGAGCHIRFMCFLHLLIATPFVYLAYYILSVMGCYIPNEHEMDRLECLVTPMSYAPFACSAAAAIVGFPLMGVFNDTESMFVMSMIFGSLIIHVIVDILFKIYVYDPSCVLSGSSYVDDMFIGTPLKCLDGVNALGLFLALCEEGFSCAFVGPAIGHLFLCMKACHLGRRPNPRLRSMGDP